MKNTNGIWPHICVFSWDFNFTRRVTLIGDQSFISTGDPLKAWRDRAKEADIINAEIMRKPSPFSCYCPERGSSIKHPCGKCGIQTPCKYLSPGAYDLLQCKSCNESQANLTRCAVRIVRVSLERSLKHEFRRRGWDKGERFEQLLHEGRAKTMSDLSNQSGTAYLSAFSRKLITYTAVQRYLMPSVDAVFPYGNDGKGCAVLHAPTNICIIEQALNFMKSIHLPITVQKIADYFVRYSKLKGSGYLDWDILESNLVTECDRLTTIRINAGWKITDRSKTGVTAELMEYLREEWVSGKFRSNQPQIQPNRRMWANLPRFRRWSSSDKVRLQTIFQEIEEWTGVTLPQRSGCPYFCHSSTMPSDWDWSKCQNLMESRLARMTEWCNRNWDTVDTADTIFLECVFQVCIGKMVIVDGDRDEAMKRSYMDTYGEFLGLPLNVYHHNPLTFVVAHRNHGEQMRTGWPAQPTTIKERLDGNTLNNILIESRTSNYLKHDFHSSFYSELKELVKSVQMPTELVNEELPLTPYNELFERQIEKLEFDDDEDIDTCLIITD